MHIRAIIQCSIVARELHAIFTAFLLAIVVNNRNNKNDGNKLLAKKVATHRDVISPISRCINSFRANALSSRARAGRLLRVSEFMRPPVGPIFQSAVARILSYLAAAKSTGLLTLPRAIAERTFPYIHRGGYLSREIYSTLSPVFIDSPQDDEAYNDNGFRCRRR